MDYDVLIIGGGPGGYGAALRAARYGAKVALAEKENLGGTCLNQGCIPTKALAASAGLLARFERAGKFGLVLQQPQLDYARVLRHKDSTVQRLARGLEHLLKQNNITVLRGTASFVARDKVQILGETDQVVRAKNIIIATGSQPVMPAVFRYDGIKVQNSTDMLASPDLPSSLLIVGGGVVGCEFAAIFSAFGVSVTLVEMADTLLPAADKEVSRYLAMAFKRRNIDVRTGCKVESVDVGSTVAITLSTGEVITAERMLVAIGRAPYTAGLNFKAAGVAVGDRGEVQVNVRLETNVPGIYAIGDVNNLSLLAHAATAQGNIVADRLFGGKDDQFVPLHVPSAVFTVPELAMVGESEEQLKARGAEYIVGKAAALANGKAACDGEDEGFVKILAGPDGQILGVHVVGPHAAELIHEAAVAYRFGLGVQALAETIHVHPTVGEMVMEAAANLANQ